jgi:predicted nucleic acid-binding protein
MKRVLADTGPIVALLNPRDHNHAKCVATLHTLPGPLFTCWPVITEAAWLLRRGRNALELLLGGIESGFLEILPLATADAKPIAELIKKYGDMEIQLADASLVHLAAKYGLDTVFTLDRRDFSAFRLPKGRWFRILP